MTENKYAVYQEIFRKNKGIMRVSTAIKLGIPKHIIYEMLRNRDLVQEGRGLYRLSETGPLGNPDLVQVSLLIPRSVIFLISSLYFHGLTTQIPRQVYIALPQGVKERKLDYPPLRVFHLSSRPFLAGMEKHVLDGITVQVYDKEKTITDCFKYRNQIGMEVALEALKDYMRQPSPDVPRLMNYARINRVEKLIRPYVETLL
jgi:predicted transcriptional regulator of viral defense system